jgi:hypothetical protein
MIHKLLICTRCSFGAEVKWSLTLLPHWIPPPIFIGQ